MPEGHTIHRLARQHAQWFVGEPVTIDSPQGRFAREAAVLSGRAMVGVEALGKHLFHRWDHPRWPLVHIHLGLFGRAWHPTDPAAEPRGTVRMRLIGPRRALHLIGPTCCELLDRGGWAALRGRLGEDPLRADADPERACVGLMRRRRPIAAVLLDQAVIAGLGNVYRAELCFLLGLDPFTPADRLSRGDADLIWSLSGALLTAGTRTGRIVVAPPRGATHPGAGRRPGDRLYVYKRSRCRVCGGSISRAPLEGRTLYWCPACQVSSTAVPPVDLSAVLRGLRPSGAL